MQKRLMSIVLVRNIFEAYGWNCHTEPGSSYRFSKQKENDIYVSTESDNSKFVDIDKLINMISCDMRAVLSKTADGFKYGIDVCINPGDATKTDVTNLLEAISEMNIALGGDVLYPELIPCSHIEKPEIAREKV